MDAYKQAFETWRSMGTFRRRRQRYKNFTYGRQWDDAVKDPDTGRVTSERELLSKYGRPPLTNNLIRQLVKSVIGRFRQSRSQASEEEKGDISSMRQRLTDLYRSHQLDETDSRLLEEFLISGVAVQRIGTEYNAEGTGNIRIDNVNPNRFFIGTPRDGCCRDIEIIGMLHDLLPEEAAIRWGGERRKDVMRLLDEVTALAETDTHRFFNLRTDEESFYRSRSGHVRVAEVWRLEPVELLYVYDPETGSLRTREASSEKELTSENRKRKQESRRPLTIKWKLSRRWTGRWYLQDGRLLHSETAEEHPFVVRLYPLIDGEIHSLVEDVIDQQKYVNRLINLIDRMMASAAKGALLYPVDALPEGSDFNDILRQWSSTDGVVLYKSCPGDPSPKQLSASLGDIGAKDLLKVEMDLFKEISGVGDTLSAKSPGSSVGAERYAMELQNASLSIKDLTDTFGSLLATRDTRLLKLNSQLSKK